MNDSRGRARILLVSPSLGGGGAERVASNLISQLDRSVFKPFLCMVRDRFDYKLPDDVQVFRLHKRKPWHLWRTMKRLERLLREIRPDVLVSAMSAVNWITGMALRRSRVRAGWVAQIVSNPALADGVVLRFLTNRYSRTADFYAANSRRLASGFVECYPFGRGRTGFVPNLIDFESLDCAASEPPGIQPDPRIPTVISVGRLHRAKRPDILLEAFALVRRRTKANLWILGEGPMKNRVEALIRFHGLQDCVRLLGFRPNPHALMKQAALFVMTSDFEGLPNALIEAQALGLPAVSTRCDYGPDEIVVPGKTAILTDVGDSGAIADGITGLLSDPDRRLEMGRQAREHVRRLFDTASVLRQWENLFLRVRSGSCQKI